VKDVGETSREHSYCSPPHPPQTAALLTGFCLHRLLLYLHSHSARTGWWKRREDDTLKRVDMETRRWVPVIVTIRHHGQTVWCAV